MEIKEFNEVARKNLRQMFLDKDNFLEILTEANNVKLPYSNIEWKKTIGLNDKDLQMLQEMEQDLGKDIFLIDEDTLYREYFLWFVRHAKKIISSKNKEEN